MFHVKHEGWEWVAALGVRLHEDALERLERFERLLSERAIPMGMIAPSDASRLRHRHIADSLRAAPLLPGSGTVCDLGSGAGLPGLVLAIVRPDLRWVLIEVRRNRATFLQEAASDMDNVTVYPRRVETFRQRVDTCTARAFGSAATSWAAAERLLVPAGSLIYWAGSGFDPSSDLPEGVSARFSRTSALARSGPLVIMTRQ
jgi:16S rRNA (guanine527-N7)-methyltransferase